MKLHSMPRSLAPAVALLLSTPLLAQTSPGSTYPASPSSGSGSSSSSFQQSGAASQALATWEGRTLQGNDGQTLGTVRSLLLDARSGNVTFAVVAPQTSSGDDRLRLVPFALLHGGTSATPGAAQGAATAGSAVRISSVQWQEFPQLQAHLLAQGSSMRASVGTNTQTSATGNAGVSGSISTTPPHSATVSVNNDSQPVGATSSSSTTAGRTETRTATTGGASDERLTPTGRTDPAPSSSGTASVGSTGSASTGATSTRAPVTTAVPEGTAVDPVLESGARSAMQNIRNHPPLRDAKVEVIPYNGRLILRGYADTEELKSRIEDAARQGARGLEMDSHLLVRPPQP